MAFNKAKASERLDIACEIATPEQYIKCIGIVGTVGGSSIVNTHKFAYKTLLKSRVSKYCDRKIKIELL